jgi:hypothetical protein
MAQLERFRRLVFQSPELQAKLMGYVDPSAFLKAVVASGEERGFHFKVADAGSLFERNRMDWEKGQTV